MEMNLFFWKDRRVLLTGHTGFKGSWLSLWLQHLGAEVFGYSLAPLDDQNLFTLADVSKGITSEFGDVRDLFSLNLMIQKVQPEIVIHMAAQALVRYGYHNPVETYSTNVMGTVNLFEAVRQCKSVRAVVSVTSDKCYENMEWEWGYRENEPLGGHDPYSSSKAAAELVTSAYRSSYLKNNHVAVASARAGNVIGGGDWAKDRLVPDVIKAYINGKPAKIRNPEAIRPWQHVLEPLSGYLTLAENLYLSPEEFSGAWNFGPNDIDAKPVRWVVNQLAEAWGIDPAWQDDELPQLHEAHYLKLDISKARLQLGWEPKWTLGKALELTGQWYRGYSDGIDPKKMSIDQIEHYQESIR
jgi:CDP-glucose 4,6-dehydratase